MFKKIKSEILQNLVYCNLILYILLHGHQIKNTSKNTKFTFLIKIQKTNPLKNTKIKNMKMAKNHSTIQTMKEIGINIII